MSSFVNKLLSTTAILASASSVLGADTTPPVVTSFNYGPQIVIAGSKFSATLTASDSSGIDRVVFSTSPQKGWWFPCSANFVLLNGTNFDGTWGVECDITPDTPNQYYNIQYIAYDIYNNAASKNIPRGFQVKGGVAPDYVSPVIQKLSYPTQTPAGAMFTTYLTITDDTGVKDGYMVTRQTGGYYIGCTAYEITLDSGTATNGVWKASCFIESTAPNGDYYLEIHVNDVERNPTDKYEYNAFTVFNGAAPDKISPTVTQVTFADTTLQRGQTLEVTAQVSDLQTGINHVDFYSGQTYSTYKTVCKGKMSLKSGDTTDGVWAYSCEVPMTMDITNYYGSVTAYDNQGNSGFATATFQIVY